MESDLPSGPSDWTQAQKSIFSGERKKFFLYPFLLGRDHTWTRNSSSLLDNTCQPFRGTDGAGTPVGWQNCSEQEDDRRFVSTILTVMPVSLVARNTVSGKWFLIQWPSSSPWKGTGSLDTTLPHKTSLVSSDKLFLLLGKLFDTRTVTATVFQFLKGTKISNPQNQNFRPSWRKFYPSFIDMKLYSNNPWNLSREKLHTLDLKHRTFQIKNSSLFHCLPDLRGRWKSTGTWFDAWKTIL